jgi:DNA polymerase III delta subunit
VAAARGDLDAAVRKAVKAIESGDRPAACLVAGEDPYLRGRAAKALGEALLPEAERTPFNFQVIDGGEEDPREMLASLRTYSLFGGNTILWVPRSRLLVSSLNASDLLKAAGEAWTQAVASGEEPAKARAARDVLKVLTVRQLGLEALDPDAEGEDTLADLMEGSDPSWLGEVGRYCVEQELSPGRGGGEAELAAALVEGWPEGNTLVLIAEACDRRLKLFKAFKKHGLVLDAGAAPRDDRSAEQLSRTELAGMAEAAGAQMAPAARSLLERKVGFDLSRLENEVAKLATYVGEGKPITEADVEAVVGWTREEGQWELANAVQERDLPRALRALRRMLDHGAAPVRIFFQIASKVRDLLHAHALIAGPLSEVWRKGMDQRGYQARVRPRVEAILEEQGKDGEAWTGFLRSHPWALFKSLEASGRYEVPELLEGLEAVYRTNWSLVSGGGPAPALLDQLVVGLLSRRSQPGAARRPGRGALRSPE